MRKLAWPAVITLAVLAAVLAFNNDNNKKRNQTPSPSPTTSTSRR